MNFNYSAILSFIVSLSGNLFLAGIFFFALFLPGENTRTILSTGMLIFLLEFLSIHASGMALSAHGERTLSVQGRFFKENPKIALLVLYSFFAISFAFAFKNLFIPFYFFLGLTTKFFGNKITLDSAKLRHTFIIYFATIVGVLLFAKVWEILFPLPPEFNVPQSTALFLNSQTLLMWGAIYFVSLAASEVILFVRRQRHVPPNFL